MKTTRSGRAAFTQAVTAPFAAERRTGGAHQAVERPLRVPAPRPLQFVYEKPFAQTIVADGKALLALRRRPEPGHAARRTRRWAARWRCSAPDLAALRADFTLESAEDQRLAVGAGHPEGAGGPAQERARRLRRRKTLAVLGIVDSFGQRSLIRFTGMQLNPALPAGARSLSSQPPAGA
ncbi:MAG: outer-membrane lipoprotein carrier protein LolA [Paenacidovorax caeni]